ncbi:hypothetical protein [Erwinia phage Snitter]|nr:hypothetical protein [Erwinia phage Snitter]
MFGMSEPNYNIAKKAAKAVGDDLKKALEESGTKGNDRSAKYNELAPAFIIKGYSKVETLMKKEQFVWLCGYMQGRFGGGVTDYE